MLLRFEVSSHRSILDPVELSMVAVDEDRAATRGFDHLSERVLTVVGIYGPNASGKSTVLEALACCRSPFARLCIAGTSPSPALRTDSATARTGPRPSKWTLSSTVSATGTGWRSATRPFCTRACTATPSGGGGRSSSARATTSASAAASAGSAGYRSC